MAMLRAQKFLALCGRPWLAAMLVWLAVLVAVYLLWVVLA